MASNLDLLLGGANTLGGHLIRRGEAREEEDRPATGMQKWLAQVMAGKLTPQQAAIGYKLEQGNGGSAGAGPTSSPQAPQGPGGMDPSQLAMPFSGGSTGLVGAAPGVAAGLLGAARGGGAPTPAPGGMAAPGGAQGGSRVVMVPDEMAPSLMAQGAQPLNGGAPVGMATSGLAGAGTGQAPTSAPAGGLVGGGPGPMPVPATNREFNQLAQVYPHLAPAQKGMSLEDRLAEIAARGAESRKTEGVKQKGRSELEDQKQDGRLDLANLNISSKEKVAIMEEGGRDARKAQDIALGYAKLDNDLVIVDRKMNEAWRRLQASIGKDITVAQLNALVGEFKAHQNAAIQALNGIPGIAQRPEAVDMVKQRVEAAEKVLEQIEGQKKRMGLQQGGQPRTESGGGFMLEEREGGRERNVEESETPRFDVGSMPSPFGAARKAAEGSKKKPKAAPPKQSRTGNPALDKVADDQDSAASGSGAGWLAKKRKQRGG